jgi:DNA-binding XRE family transcriptional regulator
LTVKPETIKQEIPPAQTVSVSSKSSEDSLSQAELAKRFGVNESSVSRNKEKENFPEWSRKRDPESIPWKYCEEIKRFIKER